MAAILLPSLANQCPDLRRRCFRFKLVLLGRCGCTGPRWDTVRLCQFQGEDTCSYRRDLRLARWNLHAPSYLLCGEISDRCHRRMGLLCPSLDELIKLQDIIAILVVPLEEGVCALLAHLQSRCCGSREDRDELVARDLAAPVRVEGRKRATQPCLLVVGRQARNHRRRN